MKTSQPKPRLLELTDDAEIESARMNGKHDVVGWLGSDGKWYGEADSVGRFRARTRQPSRDGVK